MKRGGGNQKKEKKKKTYKKVTLEGKPMGSPLMNAQKETSVEREDLQKKDTLYPQQKGFSAIPFRREKGNGAKKLQGNGKLQGTDLFLGKTRAT